MLVFLPGATGPWWAAQTGWAQQDTSPMTGRKGPEHRTAGALRTEGRVI